MRMVTLGLASLCLSSCISPSQGQDWRALTPDAALSGPAVLTVAKLQLPVDLSMVAEGKALRIEFKSGDVIVESERFTVDDTGFFLLQSMGESFDPPLPLLSNERHSKWSGRISSADTVGQLEEVARPASAAIKVVQEGKSARSEVVLQVEDGSPKPVARKIEFRFEQGSGLVGRISEYGSGWARKTVEKAQ